MLGWPISEMTNSRREVLAEVASRVVNGRCQHPTRVAIDGVDAAGKTTLADELAAVVKLLGRPVIRASIDGFHNEREVRRRRGSMSPEGYFNDSFDYSALLDALLRPLGPGGSRAFRRAVFDYRTNTPVATKVEEAAANAVLLFDGVFLLRQELRQHFDFSIFVRADFAVTVGRAEQRDVQLFGSVDEVRRRYIERYVPGQRLYLDADRPEFAASIVLDNNDPATLRIVEAHV